MKKNLLYLLFLILLGVMIGFVINYYQFKKQTAVVITALREQLTTKRSIEKITEITLNNIGFGLENLLVKDSTSTQIPLKTFFGKGQQYLLVSRFLETNCESCVNYSIQMLKNKLSVIKPENVLFLGGYRNNRLFNQLKPTYQIDSLNVANVTALPLPAEELGYPYYFVIDSTLTVLNVFVPDKGSPSIDERYLEAVHTKFFN